MDEEADEAEAAVRRNDRRCSDVMSLEVMKQVLDIFFPVQNVSSESDACVPTSVFYITIRNSALYDTVVELTSPGPLFRLIFLLVKSKKEMTEIAYYSGYSRPKVTSFLRAMSACNLQNLPNVLCIR